jgi:hypothetical protein
MFLLKILTKAADESFIVANYIEGSLLLFKNTKA